MFEPKYSPQHHRIRRAAPRLASRTGRVATWGFVVPFEKPQKNSLFNSDCLFFGTLHRGAFVSVEHLSSITIQITEFMNVTRPLGGFVFLVPLSLHIEETRLCTVANTFQQDATTTEPLREHSGR